MTAFCYTCNLKILTQFLKTENIISIKVFIRTEVAWFIPKCTWCFVDLALTGFLVCLIHLIFTVGNYILKTINNNVSSVTIAIFSTFVKHDSFISYCNSYFFIILYSNFERNFFVC